MKNSIKKLASLSLLSVLLASATFADVAEKKVNCKDEKNYPLIEKSELTSLVNQKKTDPNAVFVVDVNSKDSFEKTKIPTAINFGIEGKNFTSKLPADKNSLIVAYCGGPKCTAWKKAAEVACNQGYKNIKHFKGGITGWNDAKI